MSHIDPSFDHRIDCPDPGTVECPEGCDCIDCERLTMRRIDLEREEFPTTPADDVAVLILPLIFVAIPVVGLLL